MKISCESLTKLGLWIDELVFCLASTEFWYFARQSWFYTIFRGKGPFFELGVECTSFISLHHFTSSHSAHSHQGSNKKLHIEKKRRPASQTIQRQKKITRKWVYLLASTSWILFIPFFFSFTRDLFTPLR